jgi:hypothetical protein
MIDQTKSGLLQYAMLGFASSVGLIVMAGMLGWVAEVSVRPFMDPLSIACLCCGVGAGAIKRGRKR